MTADLIDGAAEARKLLSHTAERARTLVESSGVAPCLATVLVGDHPASRTYVQMKANRCAATGIASRRVELPAQTTTAELVERIRYRACHVDERFIAL